jgi:hypothetical protein
LERSNAEANAAYEAAVRERRRRQRQSHTGPLIRPEDFGLGVQSLRPE